MVRTDIATKFTKFIPCIQGFFVIFTVGQIRERLEIVDAFVNDTGSRKTVHELTLPRYFYTCEIYEYVRYNRDWFNLYRWEFNLFGTRSKINHSHSYFYRITDLERLSIKVEEKKNTLLDLYKCYQGAKEIGNLVECLKNMDSELINQVWNII